MPEQSVDFTHWQAILIRIAAAGDGADGAHDLHHLHRVWANARTLIAAAAADGQSAYALIVMAACYLHDLVNLPKHDPRRAQASHLSARQGTGALIAAGFPPALLGDVAHAIEAHSFSAAVPARTLEARIVQDADRLDALGAVGLARLFYTAGRMGSSLADGADPLAHTRALDDRRYALDHIVVKLATLPALMQTAAGRALGEQRLKRLLAFRDDFASEWTAS